MSYMVHELDRVCIQVRVNTPRIIHTKITLLPGHTNPGSQAARATICLTALLNISGSSVWNSLHITLQTPRILRQLQYSWKVC